MERIPLKSLTLSRSVGQTVDLFDPAGNLIGRIILNRAGDRRASIDFQFPGYVKILRGELVPAVVSSQVERSSANEVARMA